MNSIVAPSFIHVAPSIFDLDSDPMFVHTGSLLAGLLPGTELPGIILALIFLQLKKSLVSVSVMRGWVRRQIAAGDQERVS